MKRGNVWFLSFSQDFHKSREASVGITLLSDCHRRVRGMKDFCCCFYSLFSNLLLICFTWKHQQLMHQLKTTVCSILIKNKCHPAVWLSLPRQIKPRNQLSSGKCYSDLLHVGSFIRHLSWCVPRIFFCLIKLKRWLVVT